MHKWHLLSKTKITSGRALQFLVTGGQPYKCSAANTLLAILANGDLLPCRRLPMKMGNLLNENLIELYLNNPLRDKIHNPDKQDNNCLVTTKTHAMEALNAFRMRNRTASTKKTRIVGFNFRTQLSDLFVI